MNEDTPLNDTTELAPAEPVQEVAEAASVPPSAGAQLKALREARGWTIEQVANQLNLASRQIDALESDNYAALPGMVIVRGFIRTYAKLLQADAAPMLAAIKDEGGATEVLAAPRSATSASFSETPLKADKGRGFPLKAVIALIVVLGIIAAAVALGQRMGWKIGHRTQAKTTVPVAPIAAQENHASAASLEAAPVAAPVAEGNAPEQADKPMALPAEAEARQVEEKSAPPVSDKNTLVMQVHQDSWIEVRRADDTVLFSELLKAGTSESIELPGPVSVVIGNAAGVDMSLRGKPIDLKGNSSNVARLNLK
ncbi:MAG TPA: RodZ domain-containing protein [Oxalicibacterium sp.]|nr:RodZ domain-containing protein [Oxalicibacterium sp.]